jgi:hypothetical protein
MPPAAPVITQTFPASLTRIASARHPGSLECRRRESSGCKSPPLARGLAARSASCLAWMGSARVIRLARLNVGVSHPAEVAKKIDFTSV